MYLYGKPGLPSTYGCCRDENVEKKFKEKMKQYPRTLYFFMHLPATDRVWAVGVINKPDSLCVYSTYEEALKMEAKYAPYFGVREIYLIAFGDEDNDQ